MQAYARKSPFGSDMPLSPLLVFLNSPAWFNGNKSTPPFSVTISIFLLSAMVSSTVTGFTHTNVSSSSSFVDVITDRFVSNSIPDTSFTYPDFDTNKSCDSDKSSDVIYVIISSLPALQSVCISTPLSRLLVLGIDSAFIWYIEPVAEKRHSFPVFLTGIICLYSLSVSGARRE